MRRGPAAGRLSQRLRKGLRTVRRPELLFALRHGVLPTMEHLDVPFGSFATVLDVGASHGQFAAHARSRWPTARIVCFEPTVKAANCLRRLSSRYRLEVYNCALDEADGTVELNVAVDDDSSSLLSPTLRQTAEFHGTSVSAVVEVERRRLDGLELEITRPCLLKIDVQGAEMRVLRGAARTLASVDSAFVECSLVELYDGQPLAAEVIAFLDGYGLRLAGFYSPATARDGAQLQTDLLFTRDR